MTDFTKRLTDELGRDLVALGQDIPERAHRDWSGMDPVEPLALVRPRNAAEIGAALALCDAHGIGVVPQGGLTGLAGGAQPSADAIAISLERMTAIEPVDAEMACITVEAGAPLAAVQQAAEDAGLFLGLDLGARGTCTIGGTLSTNAGGNRVIRYGMAREHVLGLEAVLADGTVVSSMNRMLKNNAGYDLKQLFIGSEGTLGVISRAVLRLQSRPTFSTSALCGCRNFDDALALLKAVRAGLGPSLTSFEVMWPSFYDFMGKSLGLPRPLAEDHGVYVLVESSGYEEVRDREQLEATLGACLEDGTLADAVIAGSERETADLWAVRESVAEYSRLMGKLTAFDVGLPAHVTGRTVEVLEAELRKRWPDVIALSYGHIGDSNLHLVVNVPSAGDEQPHGEITHFVYDTVRAAGGTISAEHGIGLLKRPYLPYSRTPEELALMRRLKRALDPNNILNPHKVFEMDEESGSQPTM
ncbi:FAD-binding oxidoreductase [Pararhizobium mangrovi]|uniref:FAD-binding oxidoreductase n=1 Tax=Pararhizobium mangrovi TaxID=2590452 RepID=A0A506U8H7_9HYPH|nr:FAD-binding oxidoreductase [Pararhizobium mangrovi]TPW30200.1 FAD-binding oxidoreductase [Pararhizobium mangrovi]